MTLRIDLENGKQNYLPGEEVSGRAEWSLAAVEAHLEIHLLWYTQGKGVQDVTVGQSQRIENPAAEGNQKFSFSLPDSPYSFSGRLVSLIWAVEITAGSSSERADIVMSPDGREVVLTALEKPGRAGA